MDSHVNKLAKMFREFEPEKSIGSIVGEVIEPYPDLKISILSGQVILHSEHLYINEHLLIGYEREFETTESKISATTKTEAGYALVTGSATESSTGHSHQIILNEKDYTSKGKIKMTDTLKKGDLVKLTPTVDDQIWFVDYKVKKVGE